MSNLIDIFVTKSPRTPLPLSGIELVDKTGWILGKVAGKSVLHLGPTDSPATKRHAEENLLLHPKLQAVTRELIGLDLDPDAIALLRDQYGIDDIIYGDAEKLGIHFPDKKFDAVVAGDIIEHVNNLGLVLSGIKKVLAPGGVLVITTPNALAIKRVMGALFLRQERNNPDHMYFFSPMNLWQAATRFGYRITEIKSFMYNAPGDRMNRLGNIGASLIMNATQNYALADELALVLEPV